MGDEPGPRRRSPRGLSTPPPPEEVIPVDVEAIQPIDPAVAGPSGLGGPVNPSVENPAGPSVPVEEVGNLTLPKKRAQRPKVKVTACGSDNSHTMTDADFSDNSSGPSILSIPSGRTGLRNQTAINPRNPNEVAPLNRTQPGVGVVIEPPGVQPPRPNSLPGRQIPPEQEPHPVFQPGQYPQELYYPWWQYPTYSVHPPTGHEPRRGPVRFQEPPRAHQSGTEAPDQPNGSHGGTETRPPGSQDARENVSREHSSQRIVHPDLVRLSDEDSASQRREKPLSATSLLHIMKKWEVKFSGQPHEDVELFLARIDDARKFLPIRDETLIQGLTFLLTGKAYLWYRARVQEFRTWEQVREVFRFTYSDPDYQIAIDEELAARNQGVDESVNSFFTCIRGYYSRIVPAVSETVQVLRTYRKLVPALQAGVHLSPQWTMNELEKAAKRLEIILEKANDWRPPPTPEHSVCPSLAYQPNKATSRPFHRRYDPPRQVSFEDEKFDEYEQDESLDLRVVQDHSITPRFSRRNPDIHLRWSEGPGQMSAEGPQDQASFQNAREIRSRTAPQPLPAKTSGIPPFRLKPWLWFSNI